jgi:hypothetical protein
MEEGDLRIFTLCNSESIHNKCILDAHCCPRVTCYKCQAIQRPSGFHDNLMFSHILRVLGGSQS